MSGIDTSDNSGERSNIDGNARCPTCKKRLGRKSKKVFASKGIDARDTIITITDRVRRDKGQEFLLANSGADVDARAIEKALWRSLPSLTWEKLLKQMNERLKRNEEGIRNSAIHW